MIKNSTNASKLVFWWNCFLGGHWLFGRQLQITNRKALLIWKRAAHTCQNWFLNLLWSFPVDQIHGCLYLPLKWLLVSIQLRRWSSSQHAEDCVQEKNDIFVSSWFNILNCSPLFSVLKHIPSCFLPLFVNTFSIMCWQLTAGLSITSSLSLSCLVIPLLIRAQLPSRPNSSQPPAAPSMDVHNIYSAWPASSPWMQIIDVVLLLKETSSTFSLNTRKWCAKPAFKVSAGCRWEPEPIWRERSTVSFMQSCLVPLLFSSCTSVKHELVWVTGGE